MKWKYKSLIFPLLATLCVVGAAYLAATLGQDRVLNESARYIEGHLKPISFVKRVFDIQETDYGVFRARELSYVLDLIDVSWIVSGLDSGQIYFYSLTYLLLLGMGAGFLCALSARLSVVLRLALLGFWILSPPVLLSGYYFRSAKMLVSVLLLATVFALSRAIEKSSPMRILTLFLVSVALTLSDEQGVIMFLSLGLVAATFIVQRGDRKIEVLASLGAALIFYGFYRQVLGPWLIAHLGPAPLDLALQQKYSVGLGSLFLDIKRSYFLGWTYLFRLIVLFSGDIWRVGCVLLSSILLAFFWPKGWRTAWAPLRVWWIRVSVFSILAGWILLIYGQMAGRHITLMDECVIRSYYALPIVTALTLLLLVLAKGPYSGRIVSHFFAFFLFGISAVNLSRLHEHRAIILDFPDSLPYVKATADLFSCLRRPERGKSPLGLPPEFYSLCSFMAERHKSFGDWEFKAK